MAWANSTIGELCDMGGGEVKTGPFGSQLHQSDYEETGVPVVMPKDIIEGGISEVSIARVGQCHIERLSQHQLSIGDIVYGRRGDIGRQALVKINNEGWLCGTGCLRITLGDAPVTPDFLHLYLRRCDVIDWIAKQAVGATMPNLNTAILRSIPVRYPREKSEQEKIVNAIAIYDDLIENNNRRITILEEMAQSLYHEWFVKFRFPGHDQSAGEPVEITTNDPEGASATDGTSQNTKLIDSPLGKNPEGWEYRKLGELVNFKRDSVRKGKLEKPTPYMGLEHFPRKSIALSKWETVAEIGSSKLVFKKGDILFGKIRPYFHKVGVAQVDGICSSDTFVLEPVSEELHGLLVMTIFSDDFVAHAVQTSQGTKMPRANWEVLKNYPVALPSEPLLSEYSGLSGSVFNYIDNLGGRNRNLAMQRDMMISRLMSLK